MAAVLEMARFLQHFDKERTRLSSNQEIRGNAAM